MQFLSTIFSLFIAFARTPTFRRLLVMVVSSLCVLLKGKLGLEIDPGTQEAFVAIIITYLLGSNLNSAYQAKVKAEADAKAAAEIGGINAAAAVLKERG